MAERGWLGYTDDVGVVFNAFIGLFNYYDYLAYNAARAAKPKQLRMRYVTCQNAATGRKRRALVGTTASVVWSGALTTLALIDADGVTRNYVVTGRVGERWTRLPH